MAQSPFIEGTFHQFAWDSTSLGWIKVCPRLYQYSMLEQWRPRGEAVHLRFGLHYHTAIEHYEKARATGVEHEDALRNVVYEVLNDTWDRTEEKPDGFPWDSGHHLKTRANLVRAIIWYLDRPDNAETVILADGRPAVELSFRFETEFMAAENQPYLLCGHLDRVVNFLDGAYVMDHKTTTSTISSYYFDNYSPDNQMSLYSIAAQIVFKTPVKGVIIDAAQIAVGFSRFERGFTHRTPWQLEEWLRDTHEWFKLAERYAAQGYWPMNDKACGLYGGCAFRKICAKDISVRQKFLEADFQKSEWNPLEPR